MFHRLMAKIDAGLVCFDGTGCELENEMFFGNVAIVELSTGRPCHPVRLECRCCNCIKG